MRMMSIASGSSGNCIFVGTDHTNILIDDGLSCKRVTEGLKEIGLTGQDIDAVLITHEHADHINGLGVFLRKFKTAVYSTEGTNHEIVTSTKLGKLPEGVFHNIRPEEHFSIGDIDICPMSISHDAADPVCYRLECGGSAAAVVTDLGEYNYHLIDRLQGLNALLLESNHDLRMLETGPYPYYLKQRIAGRKGHLSNESSGQLLDTLLHEGLKNVLLGHLSKENNMPPLALEAVKAEIECSPSQWSAERFCIEVAGRDKPSDIIEF